MRLMRHGIRGTVALLEVLAVGCVMTQDAQGHAGCGETNCAGWSCDTTGWVSDPGSLSKTSETICLGGSVSAPTVSGTTVQNGSKAQVCWDDCQTWTNTASISYTAQYWFEPEIPGSFTNCGTFEYAAKVKGVTSDGDCTNDTATAEVGTFTVNVIEAALKSIEFTSDHGLLKKNPISGSVWGDSSTAYETPEWVAGTRNNPISHTKNTAITLTVTISVCPAGITYDLRGDGGDGYVTFVKNGNDSTGADQGFTITANPPLPDMVAKLSKSITWTVIANGRTCDAGASGPHTLYVTYGTPAGSAVTERRVQEVCTTADGESSPGDCADPVFNGLSGSFDLGASMWGPSPIWLLHDPGEASQCPGLADYVNKHFQMLGLGAGAIRFCHAKPDGTFEASKSPVSISRTVGAEHPDPTTHDDYNTSEPLIHWDGSNPPGPNNYEATCLLNSKHYALGVGIFTTPNDVVKTSFTSISWEYVAIDDPGPPPTYKWETCTEAPWVEAP